MRGSYSRDLWYATTRTLCSALTHKRLVAMLALNLFCRNVFDWLVYCLLAASFCVHMTDVFHPSDHLHALSLRLFSVSIIFLWLRLMKHVRAFRFEHTKQVKFKLENPNPKRKLH